ncbi:SAM-dependent methyltransferase [Microbacterium sp. F2]|uniref:SAM-dependent methyltransferase n=1 Tax=Microbacterium sp. F2 TaxID=3422228 RepID=UPI003FD0F26B
MSVGNIFLTDLADDIEWKTSGPLRVIGNPPWVTSAELNRMDSRNLPPKENFKGAKGFDALLGGSNFDVCEYIILKCLGDLRSEPLQLAMLCKTQVARNVIAHAAAARLPIASARVFRIDAKKWFDAAVDACLFIVTADPRLTPNYTADVFEDVFRPDAEPASRFGVVDGRLVSDVDAYLAVRDADGASSLVWRSGLKHDASRVFELDATPEPTTVEGTKLDVESEYVFPLLKCTDIFRGKHHALRKWVLVPQKTFGADTSHLEIVAPKLWDYLVSNAETLDGRKSSIYRNRPRFSVFGHGDYTYAPYKVAVSGLHKEAVFRLVAPIEGKPVVLDDTCYFLPFDDGTEAAVVAAQLNSPEAKLLIESLVFWDSKRPITKKLLARLDLAKLPTDSDAILQVAQAVATEAGINFDAERAPDMIRGSAAEQRVPTLF